MTRTELNDILFKVVAQHWPDYHPTEAQAGVIWANVNRYPAKLVTDELFRHACERPDAKTPKWATVLTHLVESGCAAKEPAKQWNDGDEWAEACRKLRLQAGDGVARELTRRQLVHDAVAAPILQSVMSGRLSREEAQSRIAREMERVLFNDREARGPDE